MFTISTNLVQLAHEPCVHFCSKYTVAVTKPHEFWDNSKNY